MSETKTLTRPNHIVIDNQLLPTGVVIPNILFNEETVAVSPDGKYIKENLLITNSLHFIREEFTQENENTTFPILDSNGKIIGETTYKNFYDTLMSLYTHLIDVKEKRIKNQFELVEVEIDENPSTPVRSGNEVSVGVNSKPIKQKSKK